MEQVISISFKGSFTLVLSNNKKLTLIKLKKVNFWVWYTKL